MSWVDAVAAAVERSGLASPGATPGPLLLMYHGLGGEDGVAPDAFESQLDRLAAARRVVPLGDAVAALGTQAAGGLASVTFDDGYRDFVELALPRLAARAMHATLFVPAGFLGGHNAWDEGLHPRREILDEDQLRAIDPQRAAIGAHGFSHCRLAGLDDAALARETRDAKARLEAVWGHEVRHFAYPYGQLDDFDGRAERAVRDAGFEAACSTHFGRGSTPADRHRLRRVGVGPDDDDARFARKLSGAYDWCATKERWGARWRRGRSGGR